MSNGNRKNLGKTLYFSQFGGERPIPDVFVAAMERAEERTSGYAANAEIPQNFKDDPDVVDAYFDSREQRTNEKVLVVVRKKSGNITLQDIRTTDQGQTVQVNSTLFYTTDLTFVKSYPSATQDVAIKDLGNRWSIQEVAVSGTFVNETFVPAIYQGVELSIRRDDPVPDEFRRGLPVSEVQNIVEGSVVQPTLGTDDLEAKERQIAQHKKLLTRLTREGITLPFSLVSRRTNDKKQLVVITDTYRLVTTAPAISTIQDIKVLNLGEGHEVATTEVIPSVFGAESYTKQIEDLVPARFRGVLPTTLTRQILAGTAAMPTLGMGELKRTEEQITLLTKVVEILLRSGVTFPISIVDKATITEYGGGEVTITSSIDVNGAYTVDEGEGIVSSKITKLGEGHELKETVARIAGVWPTRTFARWIARLQTFVTGTKQVVAKGSTIAGISGSNITEVESVDGYREDKVISTQPLSAVDSYVRVFFGNNTNVYIPPQLISMTGYIKLNGGAGSYSENGFYSLDGNSRGAGSIQLHGSAQASAATLAEFGWVVKIPRTNNIPCVHVLLYVTNGTSRASIISAVSTALNAAGGGTCTDWPNFRPQPITILTTGEKINIQTQVSVSAHDAVVLDYQGALKFSGSSRSSGAGISYDVARVARIIQVPETIHSISTVGGDTNVATPLYASQGTINGGVSGANVTSTAVYAQATGTVEVVSAAATSGDSTIPSSGKRVHRLITEPDPEFNRTRVFAEIVDFADITP